MGKPKTDDWTFELRQAMWSSYVRGVGIKALVEYLGKTMKSVEAELWKINVQYYKPDDLSEVRAEHANIRGPGLTGPITKREARIIKIARGYKEPISIQTIARLLGRPVEKVEEFLHPGHKRASLFKR